jgi:hypothetical protein
VSDLKSNDVFVWWCGSESQRYMYLKMALNAVTIFLLHKSIQGQVYGGIVFHIF